MFMPRSLFVLIGMLFALGFACLTQAQVPMTGAGQGTPTSVSYDAATTAWVNAVVAAGGAVSVTQKGRVNDLIVALKGHSLFSANSRLWLHAGESDHKQATIDVMALAVATEQGTPTFGAGGYTGNGSSMYLDLGTRPSNYTQNSGAYGVYDLTNSTSFGGTVEMGAYDGVGVFADALVLFLSNTAIARVNRPGAPQLTGTSTNRRGLYIVSGTSATDSAFYKNGASIASDILTTTSSLAALPNFFVLARSDAGTPSSFSSDQIAASFILPGLNATQAANLSTDINAYMTAWGINVY